MDVLEAEGFVLYSNLLRAVRADHEFEDPRLTATVFAPTDKVRRSNSRRTVTLQPLLLCFTTLAVDGTLDMAYATAVKTDHTRDSNAAWTLHRLRHMNNCHFRVVQLLLTRHFHADCSGHPSLP